MQASAPYSEMSRLTVVSGGCTTWQRSESSHATIETSPGTENPICCATPSPVTARTSLSYAIAVGGSGSDRSWRVARAPLSGV